MQGIFDIINSQYKPSVTIVKQPLPTTLAVPSKPHSRGAGIQSLARALDLLEAFLEFGPEIGLTSIASHAKINKATAYRLLSTLEQRGYVERSPLNRKYRLGVRVLELGTYFQSQLDVRRISLDYLNSMVNQTNEAGFLCIREGDEALCVERMEAEQQVNIFALRVGGRQPLHWGGAPRALLAGLDDREASEYARRTGLPASTPYTITSLKALLDDIHLTQERGYVVSMNDVTLGIAAIGAPVYDHLGCVAASISLSGLSSRFAEQQIPDLAEIVLAAAKSFSHQLGFQVKNEHLTT